MATSTGWLRRHPASDSSPTVTSTAMEKRRF
jgi:hypothetical protein